MELNRLIPNKFISNPKWQVKGHFLMFHKFEWIPIAHIQEDVVFVVLDAKIPKQVIELTKHLIFNSYEFYFTSPQMSSSKGVTDYQDHIIFHYFKSYVNEQFYYKFKNLENFDFMQNLVFWSKKENCFALIKSNYDLVNKEINRSWYDYYTNKPIFDYKEEIREDFRTLYRDLLISQVL